ncbi:MAG: hypothetical protein AAF726_09775 [Planctomycetota bacterium]
MHLAVAACLESTRRKRGACDLSDQAPASLAITGLHAGGGVRGVSFRLTPNLVWRHDVLEVRVAPYLGREHDDEESPVRVEQLLERELILAVRRLPRVSVRP